MTTFDAPMRDRSAGEQPVVILVANLMPVVGVFFFDWNVFTILVAYWLENVIIGVFTALKMRRMAPYARSDPMPAGFFLLHYGVFMTVHGMFVFLLFFDPDATARGWWWLVAALVSLGFEHGHAYHREFVRGGREREGDATGLLAKTYGRLVVMHVTIIMGGAAAAEMGSPRPALLALIALKTLFDLAGWVMQLPETSPLGRVRRAFAAAAGWGFGGLILGVLLLGFPALGLGLLVHWTTSWRESGPVGGESWGLYGFGAAGAATLLAAAAAWWHEMLGGLAWYQAASEKTRSAVIAGILVLLAVAACWAGLHGYQALWGP